MGVDLLAQGADLQRHQDRVDTVEGTLRVRSPAGEGTALQVTIPA